MFFFVLRTWNIPGLPPWSIELHTKLTCCSLETIRVSQWGGLETSVSPLNTLAGCGSALSGVVGALFLSVIIFEALPFCQAEV